MKFTIKTIPQKKQRQTFEKSSASKSPKKVFGQAAKNLNTVAMLKKLWDDASECNPKNFDLEYGSTSIEIQKNTNIKTGQRVVIIDDLVATGGTAIACAELLTENFGVEKSDILILCIIDLPELGGSKSIINQGYNIETLVAY